MTLSMSPECRQATWQTFYFLTMIREGLDEHPKVQVARNIEVYAWTNDEDDEPGARAFFQARWCPPTTGSNVGKQKGYTLWIGLWLYADQSENGHRAVRVEVLRHDEALWERLKTQLPEHRVIENPEEWAILIDWPQGPDTPAEQIAVAAQDLANCIGKGLAPEDDQTKRTQSGG